MIRAVAAVTLSAVAFAGQLSPPRGTVTAKGAGVIRGRVVAATSGNPLRKARVVVAPSDGLDPTFTDDEGRFEIRNLAGGRYTISASKTGYAPISYGARRALEHPIAVEVTAGAVVGPIELRLPRGAAISGRVTDELGDPASGVAVTAGRIVRAGGRLKVVTVGLPASTDDLGEYRVGGLPEGSYVVQISPGFAFMGEIVMGPPGMVVRGHTRSALYYPGVASLTQAQNIVVRPGDEVSGIDFTMRDVALPTVTVTLYDSAGRPADGFVQFFSDSRFGNMLRSQRVAGGTATQVLEPGEWIVQARSEQEMAVGRISVGSSDTSITLRLAKPGRLSGRATFEEARPPDPFVLESRLPRTDVPLPMGPLQTGTIARDGSFVIGSLFGARQLGLRSAPAGWWIKSLTYRGRDLLDAPLEFKGGEDIQGVEAVLTSRHVLLEGTVVGSDHAPVPVYSVLLFPDDPNRVANPSRWVRWARPDQTGRFRFDDVPGGAYHAIAVDDVDETMWTTREYLIRFRGAATPVLLEEGVPISLTLTMVSR